MKSFVPLSFAYVLVVLIRIGGLSKQGGDGLLQLVFVVMAVAGWIVLYIVWLIFKGARYEWLGKRYWLAILLFALSACGFMVILDFCFFYPEPYSLRLSPRYVAR